MTHVGPEVERNGAICERLVVVQYEPKPGDPEMRPSDLTPAERSQYEKEVLASVERSMRKGQAELHYEFRGARLDGDYPDTRITVGYLDLRYDREKSPSYAIWSELVGSDGKLEYPASHAAVLLKTWALGG